MKKSVLFLAVICIFMLCTLSSNAGPYDRTCVINGVKYTMGRVVEKFGGSAKAIKGCCVCGTSNPQCFGGYVEDYDGSGVDYSLTLIAAKHNHFQCLKYLVESCGGGVDHFPSAGEHQDYTHLMYAVRNGNVEMVKYLISKGASATRKNMYGESAKDMALKKGNQEIIEALKNNSYSKLMDFEYKQELIKMLKLNDQNKEKALADLGFYFDNLI